MLSRSIGTGSGEPEEVCSPRTDAAIDLSSSICRVGDEYFVLEKAESFAHFHRKGSSTIAFDDREYGGPPRALSDAGDVLTADEIHDRRGARVRIESALKSTEH